MGGAGLSCRPVAAVTATTTTPNSIHKMSETEEEEKMTRFLSTVDSFLSASRRRERESWLCQEGIYQTCLLLKSKCVQGPGGFSFNYKEHVLKLKPEFRLGIISSSIGIYLPR